MINIYDLIDEWELHKDPAAIRKFTRHELELFLEKIEELYKNNPSPKIGSCNMGVRDTLSLLSSPKGRLKSLSSPVLLSEKVWIPDPLFGAIAPSAAEVWKKLPESGSTFLIDSPAIQTNWKPIVDVSPSERKSTLRNTLLTYVGSILSLRSLHDIGAIEFYSWEKILAPQLDNIRLTIRGLKSSVIHQHVKTMYSQDQYSLGVRLDPIGIKAAKDSPVVGLKAGDKLWLGDTSPMLVYGLLNVAVSSNLACRFEPALPGDRVMYDFVRSNGRLDLRADPVVHNVILPALNNAVFDDLVYIRKDAELLNELRRVLTEMASLETQVPMEAIRSEINDIARRLREDRSLRRAFGLNGVDFAIGLLGGGVGVLSSDSSASGLIAVLASGATSYIARIALAAFGGDASDAKARNEVIIRISKKL